MAGRTGLVSSCLSEVSDSFSDVKISEGYIGLSFMTIWQEGTRLLAISAFKKETITYVATFIAYFI
jgi:hypothetical protein